MNLRPGNDMYIGFGCGFLLVLVAAAVIGVPLRDLAVWAVVFIVLGFLLIQIMKRWQKRKR